MDPHKLFDDKSDLYAKVRPQYPSNLFKYLASLCSLHESAWDGACGNGQASIGLAPFFDTVQATDISDGQIANAIQNPKVIYSVQPSEKTDFQNDQFDLVCIAQALHWFDFDNFWPEVMRVLKPGGIFGAWGYSWFSVEEKIDRCIRGKFIRNLEPYWAKQNKLLWDNYQNVPFPFERIDPPKIEMKMTWDLNQLFGYLRSWSATKRCMEDQGQTFLVEAYDATKNLWGDVNRKKSVSMDFCVLIGRNES